MKKLNSWFSIDEQEYLMYLLKGYDIRVENWYISWRLNYKKHREDGPSVVWRGGYNEWWLNDNLYSEAEFNEAIKQLTVGPNTI